MELFQGVFTASWGSLGFTAKLGDIANTAVQGTQTSKSGVEQLDCFVCLSQQEMHKQFTLDGDLSIVTASLDSFSAKMGLINSLRMSSTDVTIVVRAKQTVVHCGNNFRPRLDVRHCNNNKTKIKDIIEFTKEYGTDFVSELTTGGEFIGYYLFQTSRVENRNQILGELGLALGTFVTLDANVKAKIENTVVKNLSIQHSKSTLIGVNGIKVPDGPQMLEFAHQFPGMSLNSPAELNFRTSPYLIAGLGT